MESPHVMISRAESSDLEEILSLLYSVDLPAVGLAEYLYGFLGARNHSGRLVRCAGIEPPGRLGLLASVVLAPLIQRSELGTRLTQAILQFASRHGCRDALLLTTNARDFF